MFIRSNIRKLPVTTSAHPQIRILPLASLVMVTSVLVHFGPRTSLDVQVGPWLFCSSVTDTKDQSDVADRSLHKSDRSFYHYLRLGTIGTSFKVSIASKRLNVK